MWTTSSSRAKALALPALLLLAACPGPRPATVPEGTLPPDAPREAAPAAVQPPQDTARRFEPVELRSVRVLRVASDTMLARLGRVYLDSSREALALEVMTAVPLAHWGPDSSPEIYLNGARIGDTWMVGASRLVVFLRDRRVIRPTNLVAVAWIGNEPQTMSRRPLTLREDELPR